MRILFDHQVFSWQKFGGISRYFAALIHGLQENGHQAILPKNFYSENIYLEKIAGISAKPFLSQPFKGKGPLQNFLGKWSSNIALQSTRPDIFHPTYYDPYFLEVLEKTNIPFVLTVHDMIHEKFGHGVGGFFSLDAKVIPGKRQLAQKAAAIIAVSDNTRQDLIKFCPEVDPSKIKVVHHGNSLSAPTKLNKLIDLPVPYVLFVGGRGGYKNFNGFVESMAAIMSENSKMSILFAGSGALKQEERDKLKSLGIENRTFQRSFEDDSELAEMYQKAECFVFPSQYEGFGIPILESFACGCPAILNKKSSLPEVGGDAVLYFDDQDPQSLIEQLERLMHMPALRQRLIEKGYERVRSFSWQKTVLQHQAIYEAVIAGKNHPN